MSVEQEEDDEMSRAFKRQRYGEEETSEEEGPATTIAAEDSIVLDEPSQAVYDDLVREFSEFNQNRQELTLHFPRGMDGTVDARSVFRKFEQFLATDQRVITSAWLQSRYSGAVLEAAMELLLPLQRSLKDLLFHGLQEQNISNLVQDRILGCPNLKQLILFDLDDEIANGAAVIPWFTKIIENSQSLERLLLVQSGGLFTNAKEDDIASFSRSLLPLKQVRLSGLQPRAAVALLKILCSSTSIEQISVHHMQRELRDQRHWSDSLTGCVLGNTSIHSLDMESEYSCVRPPNALLPKFRAHLESNKLIAKARALLKQAAKEQDESFPAGLWPKAISKLAPNGETATYLIVRSQFQKWIY